MAEKQRMLTDRAIEVAMKEYDEAVETYKSASLAKRILVNIVNLVWCLIISSNPCALIASTA